METLKSALGGFALAFAISCGWRLGHMLTVDAYWAVERVIEAKKK